MNPEDLEALNMQPPGMGQPMGQPMQQQPVPEGAEGAIQQMGGQPLQAPPQMMPQNPPMPQVQEINIRPDPMSELRKIMEKNNLAEELDEDKLAEIGSLVKAGYEEDLSSRAAWDADIKDWLALATQEKEVKSWPWANASNIKYPLMGIAAMQFSARAYPSLVPASGQLVQAKVFGRDPSGEKNARATRVAEYMSYQLSVEMPDWEEDMDKLLMQLAITGNMYKKTYWDSNVEMVQSRSISSADLVVNYWAKSLDEAERVSHRMWMYERQVNKMKRVGSYLDIDLSEPQNPNISDNIIDRSNDNSAGGADASVIPYEIIEQHCWLDINDDGFEKPYVVTFERNSGQVLRIVGRFDMTKITLDKNNEIVNIEPLLYFTKFGFIPNPNGSFYDLGFGHLLGPLNEAVNTLTNQLTDAGTLSNLQSGFIGRGLRVKGGNYDFEPGEWKWVNSVVDDMKKQILPLPTKEPSPTLLKLLELLINSGKELASVAEIFVGKMPGQNTPATTTMASIEQGMKVFTAIYKRVYRSLGKEFYKIFLLNKTYMNPQTMTAVLEESIGPGDFNTDIMHILPSADPAASSQQEALAKSQALAELIPLGTLDVQEVTMRILKAMEQPNWEKLMPGMSQTGQPQQMQQKPDEKMMAMKAKTESDQQRANQQSQMLAEKHATEQQSSQAKVAMEQQSMAQKQQHEAEMGNIKIENARRKQAIFEAQQRESMRNKAKQ